MLFRERSPRVQIVRPWMRRPVLLVRDRRDGCAKDNYQKHYCDERFEGQQGEEACDEHEDEAADAAERCGFH